MTNFWINRGVLTPVHRPADLFIHRVRPVQLDAEPCSCAYNGRIQKDRGRRRIMMAVS
jgi:hypothetical protein